jgi:hypothetical protein
MNRISEGVTVLNILFLFCALPSIFNLAINILNKKFFDEFKEIFYCHHQEILRSDAALLLELGKVRRKSLHMKRREIEKKKSSSGKCFLKNPNRRYALFIIRESRQLMEKSIIESRSVKKYSFSNRIENISPKSAKRFSKKFDNTVLKSIKSLISNENNVYKSDKIILEFSNIRRPTYFSNSNSLSKIQIRRKTMI